MLKIIGMFILTLTGMMTGLVESRKLSMRVDFLEQYLKFIGFLETEIRYSAGSITQLINKYKENNILSVFLNECTKRIEKGNSFIISWGESLNEVPKSYGLKTEDVNLIKSFADELGTSDVEGQMNHCKLNFELTSTYLDNARNEKKKKAKLYLMLGLFSGIAVSLLFS